jgi:hypothetical protein
LDGIPARDWPKLKLQQLIEYNIHPHLTGLRIHRVPLTCPEEERIAFVIDVPQGQLTTARAR